jgi:hypothetical protein
MPRTINEELAEKAARQAPETSTEKDLADRMIRRPRAIELAGIGVLALALFKAFAVFDFLHGLAGLSIVVALAIGGAFAAFELLQRNDEQPGAQEDEKT